MRRTKKTTLLLDDAVLYRAKMQALQEGRSVSALVNEAISAYMSNGADGKASAAVAIPRSGRRGDPVPFDMNSNVAILDYVDEVDRNLGSSRR